MPKTETREDLPSCPRRRWGRTELSIPVIPFGTQGFGNHFGPVSDDEAVQLVRRAVDLGVNHFDCARCYGDSLRKLGLAIKDGAVGREEIVISGRVCCHSAAKWGGYGEGEPDYSAEHILADVEDQLGILGTDHFDALFVHDPPAIDPTLAAGGAPEGLERAREKSQVKWIGYGMNPHDFHIAAIESGRIDALLTFSDFNLLRQTAADDILPTAAERDIGVLNGWSIMRGTLTGVPMETLVARDKWVPDHRRAEAMRIWCEERDLSLLQLALQFCLSDDRVHGNPIGSLRGSPACQRCASTPYSAGCSIMSMSSSTPSPGPSGTTRHPSSTFSGSSMMSSRHSIPVTNSIGAGLGIDAIRWAAATIPTGPLVLWKEMGTWNVSAMAAILRTSVSPPAYIRSGWAMSMPSSSSRRRNWVFVLSRSLPMMGMSISRRTLA